jgi:hypothetical protein
MTESSNIIDEMKGIIYVQQQINEKLQNDLKDYDKFYKMFEGVIDTLAKSENVFGIIINDLYSLVVEEDLWDEEEHLVKLYGDVIYNKKRLDINKLEETDDFNEFKYADTTIQGFDIDWVCCRQNKCVIIPKSYDPQGINELKKLYDELIKSERIDPVYINPINILRKKCRCT